MITTGDATADFLLRQLRVLSRIGTQEQKAAVPHWEKVVRDQAAPTEQPMAVSFATGKPDETEGSK